jgi:hypothetical protein
VHTVLRIMDVAPEALNKQPELLLGTEIVWRPTWIGSVLSIDPLLLDHQVLQPARTSIGSRATQWAITQLLTQALV